MNRPLAHLPRSPWFAAKAAGVTIAALAAGLTIAFTASLLLLSDGVLSAKPVHAFSKQTREAGAAVFHDKGCEHCHGVNGLGTDRGPDLSGIGKRWKKDRIEQQVLQGGGGMPPFADALQPDEVKSLVDFLRAKRKTPKAVRHPAAPPPTAKPSPSDDTGL